jgi:hypothetical protein
MAVHYFKEGRKRRIGHGFGRKTVSGAGETLGLVADARFRWPYVAKGGEDSKGSTGGGERGGATRGAGRRAASALGRPAAGSRARVRETGELGDSSRKTEEPVVKSRKPRGLTVKHRQLSHQSSNGDGPKSKSV